MKYYSKSKFQILPIRLQSSDLCLSIRLGTAATDAVQTLCGSDFMLLSHTHARAHAHKHTHLDVSILEWTYGAR